MKSTITAVRHSFRQAFVNSGRSLSAHTARVATVGTETVKAAPTAIRSAAPAVAKGFGKGVLFNIVILEALDFAENAYVNHRRRKAQRDIVTEIATNGTSEELLTQLEILNRSPERRTFGQFVRDLPSRMFRRVWRATLVEAGWWYMMMTSPAWLATAAVHGVWSLAVLAYGVFNETVFNREVDAMALLRWTTAATHFVFRFTLWAGMGLFVKGVEMRLHNNVEAYCNTNGYEVIEVAKTKAFKSIATIVDGSTAEAFGEVLAETIDSDVRSPKIKQQAFAQVDFWVGETIAPEFHTPLMRGFRAATPFMYRDLVRAF